MITITILTLILKYWYQRYINTDAFIYLLKQIDYYIKYLYESAWSLIYILINIFLFVKISRQ